MAETDSGQTAARPGLVSTVAWSAVSTAAFAGTRFLASVLYARLFDNASSGRVFYLLWLSDLVSQLALAGLNIALSQRLAALMAGGDPAARKTVAAWAFRWVAALSVAGAAACGALLWPRGDRSLALLGAAFVPLQSLGVAWLAREWGLQRFRASALWSSAAGLVSLAGIALGAWLAPASTGLALAGHGLGFAVLALPALVEAIACRRRPLPSVRTDFLRYAGTAWVAMTLSLLSWSRVEIYAVDHYRGPAAVAAYTASLNVAMFVTQLAILMASGLLPRFSLLNASGDLQQLHHNYRASTRALAFVVFPASFLAATLSWRLLPAVYGQRFSDAIPLAALLTLGAALSFSQPGGSLMYALNRPRAVAAIAAIGGSVMLGGLLWLVPVHGELGAAAVRIAVQGFMVVAGLAYIHFALAVPVPLVHILKYLSAAAAAGALSYAGRGHFSSGVLSVLPELAALALYLALVRLLALRDAELWAPAATVTDGLFRLLGAPSSRRGTN